MKAVNEKTVHPIKQEKSKSTLELPSTSQKSQSTSNQNQSFQQKSSPARPPSAVPYDVPNFQNQDDVNLYIATLISENEALKSRFTTPGSKLTIYSQKLAMSSSLAKPLLRKIYLWLHKNGKVFKKIRKSKFKLYLMIHLLLRDHNHFKVQNLMRKISESKNSRNNWQKLKVNLVSFPSYCILATSRTTLSGRHNWLFVR